MAMPVISIPNRITGDKNGGVTDYFKVRMVVTKRQGEMISSKNNSMLLHLKQILISRLQRGRRGAPSGLRVNGTGTWELPSKVALEEALSAVIAVPCSVRSAAGPAAAGLVDRAAPACAGIARWIAAATISRRIGSGIEISALEGLQPKARRTLASTLDDP